jgi:hypothetical protein
MIDPVKTPSLPTEMGSLPGGTQTSAGGDWASMSEEERYAGHNWIWDKLGRGLFGAQENAQADPGLLGGIPIVGDIARAPGAIMRGLFDAGGVAVDNAIVKPLATLFGNLPSVSHLTDNYGLGNGDMTTSVNWRDPKYAANAVGAVSLMNDLVTENGSTNIAKQFMVLGQWQKQNDPEAFANWQQAQTEANGNTMHAGEILSTYLKHYGVVYNDMTPTGVEGYFDVAPELAYGSDGSFGQGLANGLETIMTGQRHVERAVSEHIGSQSGLRNEQRLSGGRPELGSRLDDLLAREQKGLPMTDVEQLALDGLSKEDWTPAHAMNWLITHGQGYSSDPMSQLAASIVLDPTMWASVGAMLPGKIALRVAMGVNTVESATRLGRAYQAITKAVGTSVMAVRADPILGPISKVARTVVDPLSALPTPKGMAKLDVTTAAGLEGFNRGLGAGALKSAAQRARRLAGDAGMETFNETTGVSAMNQTRKWAVSSIVDNLLHIAQQADVPIEARQFISEDVVQQTMKNAPKDAVSRIADFVYRNRKYWLSGMEKSSLAERFAKTLNVPIDIAKREIESMGPDELALWHQNSYSKAFTDFMGAVGAVPEGEWGKFANRVDDLSILNPHQIDSVAAATLHSDLSALLNGAGKAKGSPAKAIKAWNEAADKYDIIENLGRVTGGGRNVMERRLNALDAVLRQGHLHTALNLSEMKGLPNAVKGFVEAWTDSEGKPMWRLGFKPSAEMATGLLHDDAGKLMARFEPTIDNVTTAIRKPVRGTPVQDVLGRIVPGVVKESRFTRALSQARDAMEVAVDTSRDMVSGERIMTSMEQSFVSQLRSMGLPSRAAKGLFKMTREFTQDRGFTIAGLTPDDFFKVAEPQLRDLVDANVIKRDIYQALVRSAGGDLRLLGITPSIANRARVALAARGMNGPVATLTVEMYSKFRYALNPTFFIQAVADAPWFNMYRGLGPILRGGRALTESASIREMKIINDTLGHTGLYRDLAADITDRAYTVGWQEAVREGLGNMPGVKEGLGQRIKNATGNMILANELKFMNSQMGRVVYDALDQAQKFVEEKIAGAATDAEREAWQSAATDSRLMLDNYAADLRTRLGRAVNDEEVGRRYLAEIMGDSTLEKRAADGTLDFSEVYAKGQYHLPTTVGRLIGLDKDLGARSLGLPNIKNAADLRRGLAEGRVFIGDVADLMKENGVHPGQIKRFTDAIQFNWRKYFDTLRTDLGMTQYEMSGIEDLVTREARAMSMDPIDYLTQVKSVTAGGIRGVDGLTVPMQRILAAMRLSDKGEMTVAKAAELVLDNMHPSMKERLLASFEQGITGRGGMIEQAQAAGDKAAMRDLNKTVEQLRGGWAPGSTQSYIDALRERVTTGVPHSNPEVERAFRYFSDYVQNLNPKVLAGEQLREVADSIPVAGSSPYDMTQHVLMNALETNFRLQERDAIRLAHMPLERSVLDRSINHPFFGMYPSSYWWGKVIPETFRFIAYEPFGIHTTLGAETYYKVQQNIALQSQYDDRLAAFWKTLGKSAIMSAFSYLSPGMPWEDMKSSLPPYMRVLAKDGFDFTQMAQKEFDTMSPMRFVSHFLEAGAEVGDIVGGALTPSDAAPTLPPLTEQALTGIAQTEPSGTPVAPLPAAGGPVKGYALGPTLEESMVELQKALSGQ